VEILYIDRASVLLMQNWAHLTEILKNMNNMPKYESLKNSIDSIRQTFLELKGRIYRQNIVFSEFNFP
jgi:U3 small nucleolar RNA-associated protein 25